MRRHDRLLAEAYGTPWAVTPERAGVIAAILRRIEAGERADDDTVRAAIEAKRQKPKQARTAVAVLPVFGTLVQRADVFDQMSGATSTESLGQQLDEFAADPSVEAIILDIDSPGGSVYGVEEFCQKMASAMRQKKCIAVADSLAASAAYWIASQASELVVTPNGEVGSIGVYMMHRDVSKAMEAAGEAVTFISAGERKTAGHPYGPLDDLSRAELQSGVDDYYAKFVRAVARGRNVSQTAVREGFGRGGMVRAEQAVREGMADKVGTLDDVLARYGVRAADLMPAAAKETGLDYEIEVRKRKLRM